MLKVAPPILFRDVASKGDQVKLVELLKDGADPNATDQVREGSEVVVKSWWWRERGGRSRSPAFRRFEIRWVGRSVGLWCVAYDPPRPRFGGAGCGAFGGGM